MLGIQWWCYLATSPIGVLQDEVQQMRIPVRLWAQLRLMLQQAEEAELPGDAAGGEQTAWSTEPSTAASTSASPGMHLQQGQQQQQQQTQAHAFDQGELTPGLVPAPAAPAAAADDEGDGGDAEQEEQEGSGAPELQAVLGVQDSFDDLPADIMQVSFL